MLTDAQLENVGRLEDVKRDFMTTTIASSRLGFRRSISRNPPPLELYATHDVAVRPTVKRRNYSTTLTEKSTDPECVIYRPVEFHDSSIIIEEIQIYGGEISNSMNFSLYSLIIRKALPTLPIYI